VSQIARECLTTRRNSGGKVAHRRDVSIGYPKREKIRLILSMTMAPPSPHRNGGINRLLQGLNHGLNNLIRGGPRVEETASSEDEESPKVVTGVLEPVAVANIGGNQNHDTIALQPEREQYNDHGKIRQPKGTRAPKEEK